MAGGDNRVFGPPDELDRNRRLRQIASEYGRLFPLLEHRRGEPLQRHRNSVQSLELEEVIDHLSADQIFVGEEILQHGLEVAPGLRGDKPVDVTRIDLSPEPRGTDERQTLHEPLAT